MTTAEKLMAEAAKLDYAQVHKRVFRIAFDCLTRCWPPEDSVEYFQGKAHPICAVAYADMGDNQLGKDMIWGIYKYLEIMAKELEKHEPTQTRLPS